ncbi:unnamed protein product [Caenorhabditis auriculariae]|uniref:molybdopterin molybdotransferase n=1 Tax=Caenorhabditis auriculariae TaxID=2777116 RepID=A0A8S1HDB0_9PELO|nr:unnamed protein product [Caenorhabditis auriculariae]
MPTRVSVVTVSDSSFEGKRADESGPTLARLVAASEKAHVELVGDVHVVPDVFQEIASKLQELIPTSDVIITTGGTGFAPRDVTPEATLSVLERRCGGLETALHMRSLQATPMAALSRAVVGIASRTLIINFPGSVKAVKECWEVVEKVVDHAVALICEQDDGSVHRVLGAQS